MMHIRRRASDIAGMEFSECVKLIAEIVHETLNDVDPLSADGNHDYRLIAAALVYDSYLEVTHGRLEGGPMLLRTSTIVAFTTHGVPQLEQASLDLFVKRLSEELLEFKREIIDEISNVEPVEKVKYLN